MQRLQDEYDRVVHEQAQLARACADMHIAARAACQALEQVQHDLAHALDALHRP